jgi:hypothetical protein
MSERGDNANRRFTCEYQFDGIRWGVDVWASTFEEAEMKLRAMASGKVLGPVHAIIPADGKCPTCKQDIEQYGP